MRNQIGKEKEKEEKYVEEILDGKEEGKIEEIWDGNETDEEKLEEI